MLITENPFKVFTPEDLNTEQMMELFFEVPYLNNVQDVGNTVLNGPRGSGKSMLFRYLKPDCQMEAHSASLRDLPFFGVSISIKKAADLTELRRLHDYSARIVLGEHALATYVGARLFEAIIETVQPDDEIGVSDVGAVYDEMVSLMVQAGGEAPQAKPQTADALLLGCKEYCEKAYSAVNQFARRLTFSSSRTYEGPLCDYLTFLYPIIRLIRSLPFMPRSGKIFLMFDDADHLAEEQTKVLNSWLVARTQGDVSIKVAVQLHKTLATANGDYARAPHDFQQINMADIYTTKRGVYRASVRGIIANRLRKVGISATPEDFFPPDSEQEARIVRIGNEIRNSWREDAPGGYRPSDDVLRYARPQYMKQLGGSSKSTSSFIYAGFGELVHVSSGQVRYFLEPAAKMFDVQRSKNQAGNSVDFIDHRTQSEVLREEANALMFGEFEDLKRSTPPSTEDRGNIVRLRNLILFLGGFFRQKLISEDSERRIFSVAVTRGPEVDVADVLDLGVRLGYFHPSSLGNKEGTGRVRLHILNRRLAPYFNLDPSSFSGYQFFTNSVLRRAINGPVDSLLAEVRRRGFGWVGDDRQMEMF